MENIQGEKRKRKDELKRHKGVKVRVIGGNLNIGRKGTQHVSNSGYNIHSGVS